jgi:predicted Rossmann fold nucleotide-binding protein DprA/Smf involved in DNA uptake
MPAEVQIGPSTKQSSLRENKRARAGGRHSSRGGERFLQETHQTSRGRGQVIVAGHDEGIKDAAAESRSLHTEAERRFNHIAVLGKQRDLIDRFSDCGVGQLEDG